MQDITQLVWVEKYRPQKIEDVLLNKKEKEYFESMTNIKNNLLFLGRSGTGKSTVAKILAKKFAPNSYIFINASEKNGIDVIRNEIMDFVSVQSFDDNQKIVILDEIDGTTLQAQQALRGVMEEYINDVKFILTGNFTHKVIEAIHSRCETFEFGTDIKTVAQRILYILKAEHVIIPDESKSNVPILIKRFFPDIRKTINEFQRCCATGTFSYANENSQFVDELWDKIKKKENVFDTRRYLINNTSAFNNDYHHLMRNLFDKAINDSNVKATLLIVDYMEKDTRVKDPEVNFTGLLFNLHNI